ncbi:MAG TPA: glycoside hydrolase family 25 protein [Terriglobales bacterium]|nr:glycoside hydrolase family 25 protein [Terriglobales bacterium]
MPDITTPHVSGLDIYHGDIVDSFHDAYDAGTRFCFIKATQGAGYVDPGYLENYTRAKSVGMLVGAYLFYDPQADPLDQASHFLHTANPAKGDLLPVIDIETFGPSVGPKAFQCAGAIKKVIGRLPIIYSGDAFYQSYLKNVFQNFTLWIARYGAKPVTPCQFWQFSESARMAGAPLPLDSDVFFGTPADLQQYVL